jgi:hypothetical protein
LIREKINGKRKKNSIFFYRTLASDDYTDVRLGGHGTLHGYSNIVNPFLEVSLLLYLIINIHFVLLDFRYK